MDLKSLFYNIFKTLNPYNHQELTENKLWVVIKYYFFIIIFSIIIMSLLFLPKIYSAENYVQKGVSHFDNLTLSSQFILKDSFNILSDPLIRLDAYKSNNTKEMLVITPENIYYKRFILFGQYEAIPMTTQVDVVGSDRAQRLLSLGFFFILPSLLFWAFVTALVYFAAVILLTYLIVIIISNMLRINVSLLRLLKMCIYASTPFILLQLLLMPFIRVLLFPMIVYWVLIIVVLFLWQDSMFKNHKETHEKGDWESKGHKIFEDHAERHKDNNSHSHPVKDSYDVDENGNVKSSGKKHKNFDSENDGYIELK